MIARSVGREESVQAGIPEASDQADRGERAPIPIAGMVLGLMALTSVIVIAACQSRPSGTPAATEQPREVSGAAVGSTAADFTVTTLDHGPFTLSAQRGKPTVLFFTSST